MLGLASIGVVAALAGCASAPAASFGRPQAQADVSRWTAEALRAVGSATAPRTTVNGFEACRTDNGFFTTTFQWRTGTEVAVAQPGQAVATAAIVTAFERAGWKVSVSRGFTTLSGPGGARRRGVVQVQTAGPSGLAIEVISPCYA
jgi:hypothetical protein